MVPFLGKPYFYAYFSEKEYGLWDAYFLSSPKSLLELHLHANLTFSAFFFFNFLLLS